MLRESRITCLALSASGGMIRTSVAKEQDHSLTFKRSFLNRNTLNSLNRYMLMVKGSLKRAASFLGVRMVTPGAETAIPKLEQTGRRSCLEGAIELNPVK